MAGEPIPGVWDCLSCGLRVYYRLISDDVYVDDRLVRRECLNGCGLMVQAFTPDTEGE